MLPAKFRRCQSSSAEWHKPLAQWIAIPTFNILALAHVWMIRRLPIEIPREAFARAASPELVVSLDEREIIENTEVQIIRAILEKSRRRWEFVWRGIRISAPIADERFYAEF